MHCIYINLERQAERRDFLEENFAAYADPSWTLHRFEAVDAGRLPLSFREGAMRDSEKACFASHVGALEMALQFPGDSMILEDDACFGPRSAEMIRLALETSRKGPWDLLFTDACIVDAPGMLELYEMRKDWEQHRSVLLADLRRMRFAGATAYIVSEQAKGRLLDYLKGMTHFDHPYDLVLRDLIQLGRFSAHVVLPFATSLSVYADVSQIQTSATAATEICWNAFRRLIWVDAFSNGSPVTEIERVASSFPDPAADAFGKIMALRLSRHFQNK